MQYMGCHKYKGIVAYKDGGVSRINVFDMVDFIVEFYKLNNKPLTKKRLYAIIYLYQLHASLVCNGASIDDFFVIKKKGTDKEFFEVSEVARKCSRFGDEDDLREKIHGIYSDIFFRRKGQPNNTERRLESVVAFSLDIPLDVLIEQIRGTLPYKKAGEDGVVDFLHCWTSKDRKGFRCSTPAREVFSKYLAV